LKGVYVVTSRDHEGQLTTLARAAVISAIAEMLNGWEVA
jgi:hypothetical protein